MTRPRLAWLTVGLVLATIVVAPARAPAQAPVTVPTVGGDVTILADRLEQIGPDNLILATGNVEITRGTARLLADRVELNRDTGDTVAEGRVIFYDGEDRLTGRRIEYNVKSGTGVVYDGEAHASPYYRIGGERMERLDASRYRIRRGIFTTCEADPPAWSFRFLSGHANLEELIWGTGGSFWVKNLPLIPFIPFFAAPVRTERQSGFLFPRFGSSSRRGYYAEVPYFWAISDSQDMTLTPTYFQELGVGSSLEYRYILSETHRGEVSGFYLNELFRDEPRDGADRNRAWATIKHDWTIGQGVGLRADINGVTDDFVFKDYGDPLPQRSAQRVESNVFLTKSWPTWNLVGALFAYQDLTTNQAVELHRLPEIRLDGVRQPLPGLPGVLYEVQSSATHFVRDVGSDGSRGDIRSRVTRPTSVLGFFTVSPFVGGRATGYDTTVTGTRVTREGFTVEETEDEARLRSLLELGTDFESRAARIFSWDGFGGIDAVLHSIEPRVNYTWIDGENLTRLPQWTSGVDDVGRTSRTSYSLTNRLRARTVAPEGTEPHRWELLRFVLGHSYDFKNDDRPLGDVTGDLIVDPNRVLHFRGTTSLSSYGDGFQTGTTDLSVTVPRVTTSIGTRFDRPNDVNFLQGGLTAEVTRQLVGRFSTNWDIDKDVFVENRFAVDLKWQCWAFTVEFVQRHRDEDEVRFALNLLGLGAPLTTSTGLGALTGARSGVR